MLQGMRASAALGHGRSTRAIIARGFQRWRSGSALGMLAENLAVCGSVPFSAKQLVVNVMFARLALVYRQC